MSSVRGIVGAIKTHNNQMNAAVKKQTNVNNAAVAKMKAAEKRQEGVNKAALKGYLSETKSFINAFMG